MKGAPIGNGHYPAALNAWLCFLKELQQPDCRLTPTFFTPYSPGTHRLAIVLSLATSTLSIPSTSCRHQPCCSPALSLPGVEGLKRAGS